MSSKSLCVVAALILLICCATAAPTVKVIADGFCWVENLAFDGRGGLFVTDRVHATITKLTYNNATDTYIKTVWVSGFKHLLGVSVDLTAATPVLYAAGEDVSGKDFIAAVDIDQPNTYSIVVPDLGGGMGNGLGVHHRTGLVYTSTEGNFLPGTGIVYVIDPVAKTFKPLKTGLWAADGLWIDQDRDLLYVGQLFAANVWVYDLAHGHELGVLPGLPAVHVLDDFCLSTDGTEIYGCDWGNGSIVSFPAYPHNTSSSSVRSSAAVSASAASSESTSTAVAAGGKVGEVLVSGLGHPTSVRWGHGGVGLDGFLFASEGDGLVSSQHADKVYRITL